MCFRITKVIRVLETFAGIGAQHKAIKNSKVNFEVVMTSEWDARAIMAYAQIHNQSSYNAKHKSIEKWSDEKINKYLDDRVFSLNSKTPSFIRRKKRDFKVALISSDIVNNNWSNVITLDGKYISNIDLLTYSFPCQGLSIANMGRGKGIKESAKSTSNLIWQIRRILIEAQEKNDKVPKYLLMENVKTLIGKDHIQDYNAWLKFLESMGYATATITLSGLNHGSLQKRERVFALSILKKNAPKEFSDEWMKEQINSHFSNELSLAQREKLYKKIMTSSNNYAKELESATPNDTPSRVKMRNENVDLMDDAQKRKYIFNTLTTKQDRHPNIGMLKTQKKNGKLDKRFITPREAYQIMGFTSSDFTRVSKLYEKNIITKESLYRQAGNSIVVQVLEDIFKLIEKIERGEYV